MSFDADNLLRGCTLADYAAAKHLPVEFLQSLGVKDARYPSSPGNDDMVPAVRVPYLGVDGSEVAAQFRVELEKRADGSDERFRYQHGKPTLLYGLWRLEDARRAGSVVIVEGPSDAQTLWLHDVPAIALRSAASWREEWVNHFEGIPRIILAIEPDAGGEAVLKAFADSALRERIWLVRMPPETKDASALFLVEPESFAERWRQLVEAAVPWSEPDGAEHEPDDAVSDDSVSLEVELAAWALETRCLPSLQREIARESKIKELKERLSAPARIVDAALQDSSLLEPSGGHEHSAMLLREAEPWPNEVRGEELLDELAATFTCHLALPEGAACALALWTLHTHCYDAFPVTPRLGICSPEKRCGKSRLLTILLHLCPRPLPASNVTSAVVFRAIEQYRPTLLIDEADTFLRDKEELRGVLNSGHTKSMAVVVRTVGDNHEAAVFSTWAPVAIAQIGRLPATLEDRALVIAMRRRRSDEQVQPLDEERLAALEPLRGRMARWALDHLERLRASRPQLPGFSSDRAADNWRPLLAIADLAAGRWPEQARRAARLLESKEAADDGVAVQLLADLRHLFAERETERLTSEQLAKTLAAMEERPWPEWRQGQPITPRQIAKLLKPFGIEPKTMRIGTSTPRGYELCDFDDAFSRYLPSAIQNSATSLQNSTFPCATQDAAVAREKAAICRDVALLHSEVGEGERKTADSTPHVPLGQPEQQSWGRDV